MTMNEFNALCGEYLIDPGLALENENLVAALRERLDTEVERILAEEF